MRNHLSHIDFYRDYFRHFSLKEADTPDTRQRAYAVRHTVFCEEKGWMASGHETIETDRFDAVSRHVLLVDKQTGSDVGTVRVIVPPSDAVAGDDAVLPIQELTSAPIIRNPDVIANAVEISRTCIIGAYRSGRREGQRDEISSAQTQGGTPPSRELTRIDSFMLPLGLFQFSARTALKTGRLTILTLMTRAFQRQLWRLGIQLTPVGAPVNLYGLRYPCLQPDLSVMFETMYRTHRGAWVIVSNHGELHCAFRGT